MSSCANTDAVQCQYKQLASGTFPQVTSVTKLSNSQLKIVGTNFFTSGFNASATFLGVDASSVVINSNTEALVNFDKGVPVTASAATPTLQFVNLAQVELQYSAKFSPSLTNALNVQSSHSGLECSYAGGCTFSITADGLSSSL